MNFDQPNNSTQQGFFKLMTIVHAALLIGQVLFAVVAFFITPNAVLILNAGDDPFFYVASILVIGGIFAGSFLYKQQLAKLDPAATLKSKLDAYKTAFIKRCALSQGASLFCIVVFITGGNLLYLIYTGVNVLYFIWIRPTKNKIEDDVNLSYEDKTALGWVM